LPPLPFVHRRLVVGSTDEATWVLTSYLVANAIGAAASNWFAMRIGRKRFFLICVAIFTASSFACGAAPTLGFILMARVLQGAGGGALQPVVAVHPFRELSSEKAASPWRCRFGVVARPPGSHTRGWLTDGYSWRYAFYIISPVGILAMLMIGRFVKTRPTCAGRIIQLRRHRSRTIGGLDRLLADHP